MGAEQIHPIYSMANIFLIVEGETEEQFYKNQLVQAYRLPDGSYNHYFTVRLIPNKRGNYSRSGSGGQASYDSCIDIVKRFLRQATHCELVVLILDYYGLHHTFKNHLSSQQIDLKQKIEAVQERLERDINSPKFKFRLQVHEFEAYLFSDPAIVVSHFGKTEKLDELKAVLAAFDNNPELINDNIETAPSKRLKTLFPEFRKTSDGLLIAQKTGVPTIRKKCLYFNELCNLFDEVGA
ncbi:MAG TPA: DUF4276 family protein [Bacteroidetes bacterium]|nr:DUF4276 family protein [Bacteroidota bacterium]